MIAAHQPARSLSIRRPQARRGLRSSAAATADGKARREIVLAEDAIAERLTPVSKRRLVEAILIVEKRNDVIAALQHLARRFGKTRLIAIDQRKAPRAGEMKKQAGEKEEGEIADTGRRRVLAIYRSCRTQVLDSRIHADERQTGSFSVTNKRWLWLLLFFVLSALILAGAFYFDPSIQHWVVKQPQPECKNLHDQRQSFWRLAGTRCAWIGVSWHRLLAGQQEMGPHFRSYAPGVCNGRSFRACHQDRHRSCAPFGENGSCLDWSAPQLKIPCVSIRTHRRVDSFLATLFLARWRLGLLFVPIPALIAVSRMYVGAHYLSDITFAAMLGVFCALLAARLLQIGNRDVT